MERKQKYIYLVIAAVLLLIYGVIAFLVLSGKPSQPLTTTAPSPTPVPAAQDQTRPPVAYNVDATKKLEQLLKERNQLSSSSQTVRRQIIQSLGNKTGVLQQTRTYTLRYIQPLDVFQAEINTIDIATVKAAVASYFSVKGISKADICRLPLTFYLSKTASQQLVGKNLSFSPIPEGC